ncbi:MAG: sulfite exporter TauE/SafE family protein [Marinobacter sp.]|uniref:sulfite exporter TauE/SafE family protein n=1 Tax=Marinobacter sp. TaxID=50741 RepID=UPI00299DEAB8|nr:sulfite exporter TauE/SafE family protein [Marinobacter sp.]MDX1635720.1 sulfite exporter TauE/SafE family protein [Marinobacter sp.]
MDPQLAIAYSSAFLIGLLGSTHCLGMCGGISASLSMALPVGRGFRLRQTLMLLCFNAGRIGSYVLIATLIALLSTSAAEQWVQMAPVLRTLAGVLLILMGLGMAQWWQGIRWVERAGAPVWRRLSPLTTRLLPVRHPGQALALGALWGWLPCGLIYSTLGWAALQPTVASAALTMLCFGLGTLPSMLTTGYAAGWVKNLRQHPRFRQMAGILLIAFGLWTIPLWHGFGH